MLFPKTVKNLEKSKPYLHLYLFERTVDIVIESYAS